MSAGPAHVVVATAAGDRAAAERIARALVERRLAACAHVAPVASVYRWRGTVETADEFVVSATTRAALFGAARDLIRALHPYELPQVTATALLDGSDAWVDAETAVAG